MERCLRGTCRTPDHSHGRRGCCRQAFSASSFIYERPRAYRATMERFMKLPRRSFLHLAASATALPAVSRFARADNYPSRPVRIIVGFAAAGAADILARLVGQRLSDRLGQPFVVENRPGGSNGIATEIVVKAPADGYTLLLASLANAVNAT